MHFDRNPFTCDAKGAKSVNDFKFGTLFSRFPSSDGAASLAVKGLIQLLDSRRLMMPEPGAEAIHKQAASITDRATMHQL